MSKVISISFENTSNYSNGINGYIIIFNNKSIEQMIPIVGYTIDELVELIYQEYILSTSKIIFQKANYGFTLYEKLAQVINNDEIIDLTPSMHMQHRVNVAALKGKEKDILYDIILNSNINLSVAEKIEIKKLKKELDNITFETMYGYIKLAVKNESISKIRAICLMQYLFLLEER
jgi:hypothetical protein